MESYPGEMLENSSSKNNNPPKTSNSHPLFRSSKILKIQDLYNYQSAIFMFDYTRKKLPNLFDSVFPYIHEIQSLRFTRQSRLLHIPRCVCECVCPGF